MKIKLIDFGVPEHQRPYRPHGNDAGADVYQMSIRDRDCMDAARKLMALLV